MKFTWVTQEGVKRHVSASLCVALCAGQGALASDLMTHAETVMPILATGCSPWLETSHARHGLQLVRAQLQAQGMHLVVQACPFIRVRPGKMHQVIDVRVVVFDSDTATQFVRGPLADGEDVDMGGLHLVLPHFAQAAMPEEPAEDVSPDVLFNREWLGQLMQSRGFQPVPGHWWAFTPPPERK